MSCWIDDVRQVHVMTLWLFTAYMDEEMRDKNGREIKEEGREWRLPELPVDIWFRTMWWIGRESDSDDWKNYLSKQKWVWN